jgi:methylase of polypeptide subunit release factors
LAREIVENKLKKIMVFFTRKDNRLPIKYLYDGGQWYFITICVQDNLCILVEETSSLRDANGKRELSSTKKLMETYNTIWQKSYYDHTVRDENDLNRIRDYIKDNPLQWELDEYNV